MAGDLSFEKVTGLILMLISAILWAFQIVYIKPLHESYDLLTILAGTFISGLITQIPVALLTGPRVEFTPDGVAIMLLTTVICLVAAQGCYVYTIKHLSVTLVAASDNVLPVLTITISFFLYGTMLTWLQILGAVLIISSVTYLVIKDTSA